MAVSANSVIEIRTGGSDTNGGGFVTGASGTDWTLQDAVQYSASDGVTAGTTAITSATASFGTDVVGNWIYVAGGTGSVAANRYEITARVSASEITVDRATGLTTGTGVTLKIGGALASIGELGGIINNANTGVSGIISYIKSGTYTLTTSTTNISGGPYIQTTAVNVKIIGYLTTRGDYAAKPIISAGAVTNIDIIRVSHSSFGRNTKFENIKVDGGLQTGVNGFYSQDTRTMLMTGCDAVNCSLAGFKYNIQCFNCLADNCGTGFFNNAGNVTYCTASNCTTGFSSHAHWCLAYNSSGINFSGGFSTRYNNCTGYNSGTYDFYINNRLSWCINCLSVNAGSYSFRGATNDSLHNCASYNPTTARLNTVSYDLNPIILTANPFTDSVNNDFSLNNDAGGGADCRANGVGIPTQSPSLFIGAVGFAGGGTSNSAGPLRGLVR